MLAVVLAVVDAAAAYWLDLAGLSAVNVWGYAAWVAAGLTLVLVAISPPVLQHTAVTYRIAAVLTATVAPLLGLVAAEPSGLADDGGLRPGGGARGSGQPAAGGRLGPLSASVGRRLRRLPRPDLAARARVGRGPPADRRRRSALRRRPGRGGGGWLGGRSPRGLRWATAAHPVLAVTTLVGGALQVVAVAAQSGIAWVAVLAVAAAVVPAFVARAAADLATARVGVLAAGAQLVCFGAVLVSAVAAPGPRGRRAGRP